MFSFLSYYQSIQHKYVVSAGQGLRVLNPAAFVCRARALALLTRQEFLESQMQLHGLA